MASRQDLMCIAGYVSWLCWVLDWPRFFVTNIYQRNTFWLHQLHHSRVLQQPRRLQQPQRSVMLYTNATPTSMAGMTTEHPLRSFLRQYEDRTPIAFAEMAAAMAGLVWLSQQLHQPTTITLATDSSIVYHSLCQGSGITLCQNPILKELYVTWLMNKMNTGHGLVVQWVPSEQNLADPLSRGVLSSPTGPAWPI
jgi:hypothetical protein